MDPGGGRPRHHPAQHQGGGRRIGGGLPAHREPGAEALRVNDPNGRVSLGADPDRRRRSLPSVRSLSRYAIGFSPIASTAPAFTPNLVVCALPPIVIAA